MYLRFIITKKIKEDCELKRFEQKLAFVFFLFSCCNIKSTKNSFNNIPITNACFQGDEISLNNQNEEQGKFNHSELSLMVPDSFNSSEIISYYENNSSYNQSPKALDAFLHEAANEYYYHLKDNLISEYHLNIQNLKDFNIPYPCFTFFFPEVISDQNIGSLLEGINLYSIPTDWVISAVNIYSKEISSDISVFTSNPDSSFEKAISHTGLNYATSLNNEWPSIGILEPLSSQKLLTKTISYDYGKLIFDNGIDWRQYSHISKVASIITGDKGLCKGAPLYCYLSGFSIENIFENLQERAKNRVKVVNRSFHIVNYDSHFSSILKKMQTLFDKFSKEQNILIVAASGNISDDESDRISAPGSCYNAITVGSTDITGNKVSDFSKYKTYRTYHIKPDVVAPGEFNIPFDDSFARGTSFSTPIVTSEVATLMKNYPFLQKHPEKVFALLCASSWPKELESNAKENLPNRAGFNQQFGAGMINYCFAANNINNIAGFNLENSQTSFRTKVFHINKYSSFIASSFWLAEAKADGNTYAEFFSDYDFYLYSSEDKLLASSCTEKTNVERIETYLPKGDYYLELLKKAVKKTTDPESGAIAWCIIEI